MTRANLPVSGVHRRVGDSTHESHLSDTGHPALLHLGDSGAGRRGPPRCPAAEGSSLPQEETRTVEAHVLTLLAIPRNRRLTITEPVLRWIRRLVEKTCASCRSNGQVSADDVFQEVLVKVWTRLGQVRGKSVGEFAGWIRTTALRCCLNARRRSAFSAEIGHDLVHKDKVEGWAVRQDLDLEAAELVRCVSGGLLPREQRLVALLTQGYTHDEIAKHLKIKPATARKRVQRVRHKVALVLERRDRSRAGAFPALRKEAP